MSETATLFKVFSGSKSRDLAEKICKSLNWPFGRMNIEHFLMENLPFLMKSRSADNTFILYSPLSQF